jgi:hypothetical protein
MLPPGREGTMSRLLKAFISYRRSDGFIPVGQDEKLDYSFTG